MRHTEKLLIRDEDLKKLWDEDRVATHYPGNTSTRRPKDARSIKPEDYEERDRMAVARLAELTREGRLRMG